MADSTGNDGSQLEYSYGEQQEGGTSSSIDAMPAEASGYSIRVGQETAANLMDMEESFVPQSPPVAALATHSRGGNRARRAINGEQDGFNHDTSASSFVMPKAAAEAIQQRNHVVKDAAGYMRQQPASSTTRHASGLVFGKNDQADFSDELSNQYRNDASQRPDGDEDREQSLPSFETSQFQQPSSSFRPMANGRQAGRVTVSSNDMHSNPSAIGTSSTNTASSMSASAAALSRTNGGGMNKTNLTLREQEKVIEMQGKENFDLKMRVHFLQERLAQLAPDSVDAALKENVDMRVRIQVLLQENKSLRKDVKKHAKLLEGAQDALETQQESQVRVSRTGQEAQLQIEQLSQALSQEQEAAEMLMQQRDELQDRYDDVVAQIQEQKNLQANIHDLETDNAGLRSQVNAQVTMLASHKDEKEQYIDEIENLKQDILGLEGELTQERDRRASSAARAEQVNNLQDQLDKYKDKLAAALLDANRKEKEISDLNAECDALEAAEDWKQALDQLQAERDELVEVLAERDLQLQDLERKLDEMDQLAHQDEAELKKAIARVADKDHEVSRLGEEVVGMAEGLQELDGRNQELIDQIAAKDAKILDLERELGATDRDLTSKQSIHDQVVAALKEKISAYKSRQSELSIQNESLTTEINFLRTKHEDLAQRCGELEETRRSDTQQRQRLEDERVSLERKIRDKDNHLQDVILDGKREMAELENRWKSIIAEKELLINSIRADLKQAQDRLAVREQDMARLNQVLQNLESESKLAGKTHTSDRMSLILEVERLNRDLAHHEADLDHARSDLEQKDEELRKRDVDIANLRGQVNDVSAQLAVQTHTRLGLSDKLDLTTKSLRDAQDELANARERVRALQSQSPRDSKTMSRSAADLKDQLAERNALLQTVYQAIDRVVGSDKKKSGSTDGRPHTNFPLFHDGLLTRLRSISNVQSLFEKRVRDLEARFADQVTLVRKQADSRFRHIDKLDMSVKSALDVQAKWKQRVMMKQEEIENVKTTNNELNTQISSLKTRVNVADMSPGTSHKLQSLAARASSHEKRLAATQAQLQATEDKLASAKVKAGTAEEQWAARLRELQKRNAELEEKAKRERQGAKERVRELEQNINTLKEQIEDASTRSRKLASVLKANEA